MKPISLNDQSGETFTVLGDGRGDIVFTANLPQIKEFFAKAFPIYSQAYALDDTARLEFSSPFDVSARYVDESVPFDSLIRIAFWDEAMSFLICDDPYGNYNIMSKPIGA